MNASSVDWREELRAKCIQSVTNQNVEPDDNCPECEDNEEIEAMEIDSKSAVNSSEALAMLDKLQVSLKRMMQRMNFCEVLLH